MRERAFTSSIIWIALAASIDRILSSIHEFTSATWWQVGVGFLVFVLILAAMAGTLAIWQGATAKKEEPAQAQAEKAKRDGREARVRRLLAALDDEDLDTLEGIELGDDGERLPLESLLKRRD